MVRGGVYDKVGSDYWDIRSNPNGGKMTTLLVLSLRFTKLHSLRGSEESRLGCE